jgi:hypothetical protein
MTSDNSHKLYGDIEYNVWKPLYFHKINKYTNIKEFGKHDNYEILFNNCKETPFIVRNKKTLRQIKSKNCSYRLTNNKINKSYSDIHIALASAFPEVEPKETVDHINDDYTDNRIINLMWMDRKSNSVKGQKKSIASSNNNGGRNGKYVIMKKPSVIDKNDRNKSINIGLFRSIEKCSRYICENIIEKDNPNQKTVSSKIRRAIQQPQLKAYGYYYDMFEIKIDEEEWKAHPEYPEYQVSTHGRFCNKYQIISRQQSMRNGSKYKTVSINNKRQYIHKLVWETWVGSVPEGMDIMHDDTAPLQEDGSYRNWLRDLLHRPERKMRQNSHKNFGDVKSIVRNYTLRLSNFFHFFFI